MRPVFLGPSHSGYSLAPRTNASSTDPNPRSPRTHEQTGMERDMVDNVSALLGLPDKIAPLASLLPSHVRRQAFESVLSIAQAPLSLLQADAFDT